MHSTTELQSILGWFPLGDRLIIKMADPLEQKGGVHIPEKFQQRSLEGAVLAVGPGFRDQFGKVWPIMVDVGDQIIYAKYAGSTVMIPTTMGGVTEEKEYLLISEKDILAVKGKMVAQI
jgi:chaperonin GroES